MRQRRSEKHTLTHRDAHATVPNCFGSCRWHGYQTTLKQACFQGYPESAVYVQVPIGSRNSAIHNAYHTSLRPSSLFEPRHPSLKVVFASLRCRAPGAEHIYSCSSTNNGGFTTSEDEPMLLHHPRAKTRGSRSRFSNRVQRLIKVSSQ